MRALRKRGSVFQEFVSSALVERMRLLVETASRFAVEATRAGTDFASFHVSVGLPIALFLDRDNICLILF